MLEGNRRITALRNLLEPKKSKGISEAVLEQIKEIEVSEIIDDCSEEELQRKITYMLGVRHHGSLKNGLSCLRARTISIKSN